MKNFYKIYRWCSKSSNIQIGEATKSQVSSVALRFFKLFVVLRSDSTEICFLNAHKYCSHYLGKPAVVSTMKTRWIQ